MYLITNLTENTLYSFRNVSKIIDDGENQNRQILTNISFNIHQGDFCGIIGESGAGKSTLLNILGGIDNISEGNIIFRGQNILSRSNRELALFRRKIGFVFQNFQLIEHLNVFENVAVPLKISSCRKKIIDQRVRQALEDVNFIERRSYFTHQELESFCHNYQEIPNSRQFLTQFILEENAGLFFDIDRIRSEVQNPEHRKCIKSAIQRLEHEKVPRLTESSQKKLTQSPKTLSGGEKQRVAIARAIVNTPDVILADEPTGSLDSGNESIILDLLKNIHSKRQGVTVILVSHSPNVISRCSKVIKLADGKIVNEKDHNF